MSTPKWNAKEVKVKRCNKFETYFETEDGRKFKWLNNFYEHTGNYFVLKYKPVHHGTEFRYEIYPVPKEQAFQEYKGHFYKRHIENGFYVEEIN